jgi:hypothetical protein
VVLAQRSLKGGRSLPGLSPVAELVFGEYVNWAKLVPCLGVLENTELFVVTFLDIFVFSF